MSLKALFIINPSSGRQNFIKTIETMISTLVMEQTVNHVDIVYTKKGGDARHAATKVRPYEYDFVAGIGGDGTINEVIEGIYLSRSNTPVAIISAGTVNDFANYLKLPSDPENFCQMIRDFRTKQIDIGQMNDCIFMNVVAGGLCTDIGYKVPKELKAVFGKMAYYIEGAKDLPKQLFHPVSIRFESKEFSQELETLLFLVTNSQSVGGYKEAAPLASVSDGQLDVLIVEKLDIAEIAQILMKLTHGDHINHPKVHYFQTKQIAITNCNSSDSIPVDYDGEYYGDLPIDIHVIEKAINVIIPK